MRRWPARDEQVGERCQNILMLELPRDDERQALPAGLVDDRQNAELAPVMRAPFDEVVGPYMTWIFGPQADTGSVVEP